MRTLGLIRGTEIVAGEDPHLLETYDVSRVDRLVSGYADLSPLRELPGGCW